MADNDQPQPTGGSTETVSKDSTTSYRDSQVDDDADDLEPYISDGGRPGEVSSSDDESPWTAETAADDDGEAEEFADIDFASPIGQALAALGIGPSLASPFTGQKVLVEPTIEAFAHYMKHAKNIVVLCGAGISTAAGIPDFRTPGTGLYSNLEQYNLPSPESVFEISYFRHNPLPFYQLSHSIMPGKHFPTLTHYFIERLNAKGVLRRVFTQNIDTLETLAGVPREKIVEAHGSYGSVSCAGGWIDPKIDSFHGTERPDGTWAPNVSYWCTDYRTANRPCGRKYEAEFFSQKIKEGKIPRCEKCGGLVKPDIVFFGESLPQRFHQLVEEDFDHDTCDLVIIMGTSLLVGPFNQLPMMAPRKVPRLMLNMTPAGNFQYSINQPPFRDAFWQGPCDDGVLELARHLGWEDELKARHAEGHAQLKKAWGMLDEEEPKPVEVAENEVDVEVVGRSTPMVPSSSGGSPATTPKITVIKPKATQIIVAGGVVLEEDLEGSVDDLDDATKSKIDDTVDALLSVGLKKK